METQFRQRGLVVSGLYGCGFRRVFTGRAEHESDQEKRACKTTLRGPRETHAAWSVTDVSDRGYEDMDELADSDGHGEEVTDMVGRHACWRHCLPQRKLNEKTIMCLTCFIGVRSVSWVEDWRDVT